MSAPTEEVEVAPSRFGSGRAREILADSWIALVLIALVIAFSVLRPSFATTFNFSNILVAASVLAVMATGQTYIIITAGIDLSVGSVLVFSSVVAVLTMRELGGISGGWGAALAGVAVGILAGVLWGLLNGLLIAKTKIPALIVTLGTLGMALGSAQLLSSGVDIAAVPPSYVKAIGFGKVLGVPVLVLIALAVLAVFYVVLSRTRFGRHTYAIGSNPEAARRAGIRVDRHLVKIYALQGLLSGLAGVLGLARFSTTTLSGHTADNLAVISAVVLGGTSLFGGYGSLIGTGVAVLIPVVLQNGLIILGVQPFWQTILIGAILIIAVFIDQLKRRARTA
ncbi:MAG: ribose transport system permease protein [Actinomycetota bacterium]|nr:ribose transport system permease protein [Actinomycetota bacterium]